MEAASATILLLGFGLDLTLLKVLMRMHGRAWRGVVVLACGWLELEIGRRCAQAKWSQGCEEATTADMRATGGRRRVNGVNPDPSRSIYSGSTGSAQCGSFRHTTCYNGSISIISREDCAGFIVNMPRHHLNSEFRSSAAHKALLGHHDGKQN
jgi:hypothetical protein